MTMHDMSPIDSPTISTTSSMRAERAAVEAHLADVRRVPRAARRAARGRRARGGAARRAAETESVAGHRARELGAARSPRCPFRRAYGAALLVHAAAARGGRPRADGAVGRHRVAGAGRRSAHRLRRRSARVQAERRRGGAHAGEVRRPHYDEAIADLEQTLEAGREQLDPRDGARARGEPDGDRSRDRPEPRARWRATRRTSYLNTHLADARQRKLALLRQRDGADEQELIATCSDRHDCRETDDTAPESSHDGGRDVRGADAPLRRAAAGQGAARRRRPTYRARDAGRALEHRQLRAARWSSARGTRTRCSVQRAALHAREDQRPQHAGGGLDLVADSAGRRVGRLRDHRAGLDAGEDRRALTTSSRSRGRRAK